MKEHNSSLQTPEKNNALIINQRKSLPYKKRLYSDILTILLWCFWLYLWKPFFLILWKIFKVDQDEDKLINSILNQVDSLTFTHALEMLIGTSLLLIIINKISRRQRDYHKTVYKLEDYANYFDLKTDNLNNAQHAQTITIYHDDSGKIINLEIGTPVQK
ncbi:hypothetical protein V757_03040 [Pelistega indica]|uniref:Poly-beta-1,6-N-acetyl-D-glucosamine biosynthesis protein PgaD n=1 Tax=Pelistega indica TaxID=1414851 RepID=V8G9L8_9BURK|nr:MULTISPECIES: poly-beta-1,6-N-acetyl-D-glucosamine biosynthesis protein PgaD [Pelistega]ETD72633.1 hypothetical protein V757_03040 [Pelistega indica]